LYSAGGPKERKAKSPSDANLENPPPRRQDIRTAREYSQQQGENRMHHANWQCVKCGNDQYEADQFRATGGILAKLFDVQNKRFTTVICDRCSYTEIYRADSSQLGDVFDFFTGG
jgi:predicted nucleic-acid-binding Zn-ribbon protein